MNGEVLVNGIDMKNLVLGYRVGLFWKVLLPFKGNAYPSTKRKKTLLTQVIPSTIA
jgi:hypothetical protein